MRQFVWIGVAGALGTWARYLLSIAASRAFGTGFPYGTLLVNLLGCFCISVVARVALTTGLISPGMRLALTTGLMGGFTTYSSFNHETLRLFEEKAWIEGVLNLGATVLGCLLAGLLGLWVAERMTGR